MKKRRVPLGLLCMVWGCAPPPAPEGLDDSVTYAFRNFYAEDAVFTAGLTGLVRWYHQEGYLQVGERATTENSDAFTVSALTDEDIAGLPLEELEGGRDLTRAVGVVSLAEMSCGWKDAEALLVRTDQAVLFPATWEGYERTFDSDRQAFEEAVTQEEFAAVEEPLDRFAEGFDEEAHESSLLLTENQVDTISLLGIDIPAYRMILDVRHGIYDIDGVPTPVVAFLTFTPDAAYTEAGDTGLKQTYSIELDVALEGGGTLRLLAAWAEPVSPLLPADSPLILSYAVNTSLDASERMNDICEGTEEVPGEFEGE